MFRMYVPVLACVALLAGCGGGDDSSSGGSNAQRLTKAEYATQANKVCSDIANEQKTYEDRIDKLDRGDFKAAAPIIEEVLEKTRDGFDKLKALSPPASEQKKVDAYHASVERLLASRDRLAAAARNDDSAARRKATEEGDKLDIEQEGLADVLALNDCGNIF